MDIFPQPTPLAQATMTDGSRFELWSHPNSDKVTVYLAECGHPYQQPMRAAVDWTEEDIHLAIRMLQGKFTPPNNARETESAEQG